MSCNFLFCVKCFFYYLKNKIKIIYYINDISYLTLIKNLEKEGKYYRNGTIFDPENGEEYRCRIALEDDNTLQVRGYLAFLYSTQYWKRVK